MRDVVFVLLVLGFFGVATAYVRACAAVTGVAVVPDIDPDEPTGGTETA